MSGRRRRVDEIPQDQAAVVGANIRVLRQQHGWNQAKLGEVMGWLSNSTVCAAEGRRKGRQRGFTADEVERLAAIFGLSHRSSRRGAQLRRAPAGRVRLSDLWSLSPGVKPQPIGPVQVTAGRTGAGRSAFGDAALPLALRRRSSSRHLSAIRLGQKSASIQGFSRKNKPL
jgi:hypothetical protein